ncbi:MAG: hypothetical protein PHS31_04400, partial [Victivallaceae bacterium]|nr:hypothetical protein [Victivallaceae bacterium]
SPAAEAAKTEPEQRLSFTGNIRFTKPSLTTTTDITITATSEELTSETDTLTVIPQYINLVVANVEEETYDPETGNINNSDKNEGSIGAFVSINDNDSNDDKNADREKNTEASGSDSDLLAVTLSKQISGPIDADHPVTLSLSAIYPATSSSMKVWKDASRSELYLSSSGTKQFTSASNLGPFYIEAVGSTSGVLSVSYTYPNGTTNPNPNNDYSSTNYYIIDSCGDNIRLNGFGVDIKLAGLDDERTITDSSNPPNTVRVLPFEIFPGGELEVKPNVDTTLDENNQVAIANGILTSAELKGSNLTETQTVTVNVTSGSDKIKLYEPVMIEDVHQVNASGVPLYNVFTGTGLNVSDLPKTIYILPIKDSASKRDVELKMSYTSSQNEATHEDIVKLTCLMLDLDVDSNNDGTISVDSYEEDSIEEISAKYITPTINDLDGDGTSDNVDYNINDNNFSDNVFAQMTIRIPESIQLDNCKIKISYDASEPPPTEGGTLASSGSLRIWTKQSNTDRSPDPIGGENQSGDTGGDYVAPTNWSVGQGEEAYYTPAQLLNGARSCDFWIEAVGSTLAKSITVTIEPIISYNGTENPMPADNLIPETYSLSDTVKVAAPNLDLDIDSDNNNGYSTPDRDNAEDSIESDTDKPGKILALNNLDVDKDGIPDFADGYDISFGGTNQAGDNKSAVFIPLILEVSNVNPDDVKIKLTYSVSDPTGVTRTGTGTVTAPYVYTPASGNLRIWTKNGDASRLTASVTATSSPGDFVPTETMIDFSALSPDSFGVTTLYIEAVKASQSMADLDIKVELFDKNGNAFNGMNDNVKVTVVKVATVTPNDTTRVIIATRATDTTYPSTEQAEDKKIKITATISPVLENVPVYFEVVDPDDRSPYDGKSIVDNTTTGLEDKNPNDNRDINKKMTGTTASYNSFQGSLSAQNTTTDPTGKAEIDLTVTDRHSGDNYVVRATCRNPSNAPFDTNTAATTSTPIYTQSGIAQSGLLVAWKRAYIEEANMYKNGATITAAVATGASGVNTIEVTGNGSGYTSGPTVTIAGGGGSGATAIATIKGNVSAINITSAGSDYTSPPTVSITGGDGSGATATASVSGGNVTSITVNNAGSNYTSAPTITITGGGGSGATATAMINGEVDAVYVTYIGSGYTSAPTVTISEGGGFGATAIAAISANTLAVDNVGDFSVGNSIVIFLPPSGATTISRTIATINATSKTLTLNANHGINIPQYSGVKINGQNDVYTNNRGYFNMSYGGVTDGSDGGAFVEYQTVLITPNKVPKYTSFPNDRYYVVAFEYASAWFNNIGTDNLYLLIAAIENGRGSMGVSSEARAFTFYNAHGTIFNSAKFKDTEVHETGHIWNITNFLFGHVDSSSSGVGERQNHLNNDMCFMSYLSNDADGVSELCLDCLYHIRDKVETK